MKMLSLALVLLVVAAMCGCGGDPPAPKPVAKTKTKHPAVKPVPAKPSNTTASTKVGPAITPEPTNPPNEVSPPMETVAPVAVENPLPKIDDEKVAAHGIRKLNGKHLTLYTDIKSSPAIDELPAVFDLAVPQWRDYFKVADKTANDLKLVGYLMQDKQKFMDAGLYPLDIGDIPNGFQRGPEFWVVEQKTDYYRRHLVLHEGTHAVMWCWLRGIGPPWYSEGMAELLGTHQWQDGKLTLNYYPRSREEVPDHGRVRLIKDAYAANKGLQLYEALRLSPAAHQRVEAYAWSWGAAVFFERHPRYGEEFRRLRDSVRSNSDEFNRQFLEHFRDDVLPMQTEWQLFVANCEYGYDIERNALKVIPSKPLTQETTVEISAEHGWQSTGLILEQGKTYQIAASGRYSLGKEPREWWCEPGGVTIRYYHGQPLGILLAAVRDDVKPTSPDTLVRPKPIGLGTSLKPAATGTLWLKINEHDAEWADNAGKLSVKIAPAP